MTSLAPIILFTYNRLEERKQTILALQKKYLAKNSEFFVFSEGSKNKVYSHKDQTILLSSRLEYQSIFDFQKKVFAYIRDVLCFEKHILNYCFQDNILKLQINKSYYFK